MERIEVDAEQIADVASFYRRASLVVDAVSHDLSAHDFGAWARGIPDEHAGDGDRDTMSVLAARYATMSATLAARLNAQAAAAAELAGTLASTTSALVAGDAAAAKMMRS